MSLRRLVPLLALIIFSVTLMMYQNNKGILAPLSFLNNAISKLNILFDSLSESLKDPFKKMRLRDADNTSLRNEINRLLLEHQQYNGLVSENLRLREVLSLKENEKRYVATAKVISKGWDPWANTLIINKGKAAGISKDMAVITPKGLVGKVTSVADDNAYVLLITDVNFSAAVKVQETRKDAILSGNGSKYSGLKYIPQEEDIKEGYTLATSGFDDLFPQEIPVGYVYALTKKSDGVFKNIEVMPFQDLTKLDEVIIVRR